MELIILTKKWGRNFTGATLATQYFVEKWIPYFESISVFTLHKGESLLSEKINVYSCESESDMKTQILKYIKSRKNSKVIGYSDDHLGFILNKCGVKYIHTYHGNWPDARKTNLDYFLKSFYFIPLYKKTLKGATAIVNVSEYMRKFTDLSNTNSVVIRNGIDIKLNNNSETKSNKFLMVGNVDKRKYGKLIKVLDNLEKAGRTVEIDVYGRVDDAALGADLSKRSNVHLLGLQKGIPFKNYLGFINTSCIENLSISVCEALINEIPVICFNVGGLAEVVKDNKNGFVINKFDSKDMAEKIIRICDGYQFSDCRFEQIEEFNWDNSAKKYLKLFESLE